VRLLPAHVLLQLCQGESAGNGLCPVGQCINCITCDGDCDAQCMCFRDYNFCCCSSPVGHYSRGYGKIRCPGGTYQDESGKGECKLCDASGSILYDLNSRGASSSLDCPSARCENVCQANGNLNASCVVVRCATSGTIRDRMHTRPENQTFCDHFQEPIQLSADCTWRSTESLAPAQVGYRSVGMLFVIGVLGFLST